MPLCDCEKYCMGYRTEPKEVSTTTYWKHKPYRKEHQVPSYATFQGLNERKGGSVSESERQGQAGQSSVCLIFQSDYLLNNI